MPHRWMEFTCGSRMLPSRPILTNMGDSMIPKCSPAPSMGNPERLGMRAEQCEKNSIAPGTDTLRALPGARRAIRIAKSFKQNFAPLARRDDPEAPRAKLSSSPNGGATTGAELYADSPKSIIRGGERNPRVWNAR